MRNIKLFVFYLMIAVLQGCASLPSSDQMLSEIKDFKLPKYPDAEKAIVYVVRPSAVGTLVRFNVFLDDQAAESEMGYTRGSQYIYFQVNPGEHKIQSKAENWSEWVINAKAGDIIYIQQDAAMGLFMARNTIFKIEDIEGKYHVKNLTLGTILKNGQ
jgi:hypothetical protein